MQRFDPVPGRLRIGTSDLTQGPNAMSCLVEVTADRKP